MVFKWIAITMLHEAKALYCLIIEVDTCSTQYRIIDKFSCHTHPPIKWTSFKDVRKR